MVVKWLKKMTPFRIFLILTGVLGCVALSQLWLFTGMYHYNREVYEKAEKAFVRHLKWNPWDSRPLTYLVDATYSQHKFSESADYILRSIRSETDQDHDEILSDYAIRLLNASSSVFSRDEIHELLCHLNNFTRRFFNPISVTISHYPGRQELILEAIRDCGLKEFQPDVENMVFRENRNLGIIAGKTLFTIDRELKSDIWRKIISGYPEEQDRILKILESQQSPELRDFYLGILDKLDRKTKVLVISSLADYPSQKVVDILFLIAGEENPAFDEAVFPALQKMSNMGVQPFRKHIPALTRFCESYNEDRWRVSAVILSKLVSRIPPDFIQSLETGTYEDLVHWMYVIACFAGDESSGVLLPYLDHEDSQVVVECIRALEGNFAPSVRSRIYELVQSMDDDISRAAIDYIGKDHGPESTDFLLELCSDRDETVVLNALSALAGRNIREMPGILKSLLTNPSPSIRLKVAKICVEYPIYRTRLLNDITLYILDEYDDEIRQYLATTIGDYSNENSMAVMEKLLYDPLPEIRVIAVDNLSHSLPPDKISILYPCLDDTNSLVRLRTVNALLNWTNPGSIPVLKKNLDDPDPKIRRAVCEAIYQLIPDTEKRMEFLLDLSHSSHKEIKTFAFKRLSDYRSPRITERMRQAYDNREKDVWTDARKFLKLE